MVGRLNRSANYCTARRSLSIVLHQKPVVALASAATASSGAGAASPLPRIHSSSSSFLYKIAFLFPINNWWWSSCRLFIDQSQFPLPFQTHSQHRARITQILRQIHQGHYILFQSIQFHVLLQLWLDWTFSLPGSSFFTRFTGWQKQLSSP